MAEMTQLIIEGIALPEASYDNYRCYPDEIGTRVEMISGRQVIEVRGHVQRIAYAYDYFTDALWRQVAAVLRGSSPFTVAYLPDDSSTMLTGTFLAESITNPSFAFSRDGRALWHNIAFELREVAPHD